LSDRKNFPDVHRIQLKDGTHESVSVLRNLSRGLIVREPKDDRIAFYKWDDITEFDRPNLGLDERTPACRLLKLLCPSVASP
jgi:hypothetical protein